ncbi:unnamed protein product [Mucor circinelloides]|uniref:Uncharacterized protein n=1 Tax=Mucor circinelloides f. circinelloides (strain 1006PhL) TaxID=1220926 RepID=S2JJ31_MUCC1|nr:hypothetical protein HMPREF1544_03282 [Mucor circinelloides 1006PhL]KAG1110586.1 hypothetical protein G6F42_015285 [Rhizopus arrhizus]
MSLPPLVFFSLTPEDDNDDLYPTSPQDYENEECTWIDDSECQENLFQIISLTPEETIIDKDNHIQTSFKLFFEELGYLTEEPEPIDPNRDYEQEAKDLLNQRDRKVRQKHVDLFCLPSLDSSRSGLSSSSSSIHHEHHIIDIRSPHYMGQPHHTNTSKDPNMSYHYGNHHHHTYHHHLHHHQQRPSRLH